MVVLDKKFVSSSRTANIKYGKYESYVSFINRHYDQLCNKFKELAEDIGPDPYDRHFFVEPVINFAITHKITDRDVDYIYRYYVYSRIAEHEKRDIKNVAADDILSTFFKIE